MSKFVVYLKLQPFVAQWLHHHFGDPVKFQPQSVENSTILQFTQKLPEGRQPDTAADGLTAVCIPDNEKKDPATYNYLLMSDARYWGPSMPGVRCMASISIMTAPS